MTAGGSRHISSRRSWSLALGALVALLALLAGCASSGGRAAPASLEREALAQDAAPASARRPQPAAKASAAGGAQARPASPVAPSGSGEAAPSEPSSQPGVQPEKRLRVYSGFLELVVNEVEKVKERIIDTAERVGGYVEETAAEYVVLRVPAERFEAAMDELAGFGELRARSVETTDVTDSYAELGRRIDMAKRTRQRLYDLLQKTEDVKERVAILREISRLTEQIERMSAALTVLEGQILLSRITVRLTPRIGGGAGPARAIPFPWIAALSPLRPTSGLATATLAVTPLSEYAVFESGRRVRLEAADGTRLAIGAVTNEPKGDTEFWRDALQYHLGDLYRRSELFSSGAFQGVIFESKDIKPFQFLVAVLASGNEILLAEAFFPSPEARDLRLAGIRGMLEGVKP